MEDPSSEPCPVCYENNPLNLKFDCLHQVCRQCFHRQISSNSPLCCPVCRASPNPNSFDDDEQKLFRQRQRQTEQRQRQTERRQRQRERERISIQFNAQLYRLLRGILDDYSNNQIINQGSDRLFGTVINDNSNNYEFRILTLQNN